MADEVEKFAKSAVQNFGMSELTAKRMASTFMSMANSMGLAAKDGKNMSLQLTALAGDMASFYNVEQDVAQTALNSIFTGETESLKKFGIVLTEANLNAFALSRGITKSYNAMSQAEKVALRYLYVLKATANAQGDFARTSSSWANQVRILKEQWSQLIGILGKGLIAALTPIVKALNKLLSYLIALGNAIASLFGGKKITGISKGLDSAAGSAGNLDDNLGGAGGKLDEDNKKAEKLAKTLASFDELDILASNDKNDSGGSGDDSGGGGGGSFEIPDFSTDEAANELIPNIQKLLDEVQKILDKWKPLIPKLEFNFDKEKALADLKQIGLDIINIIAGWGTFVISLAIKVANDLDIGKLLNDVISLTRAFTDLCSNITDAVVPALLTFYDEALSPVVQGIGDLYHEILTWTKGEVDEWSQWFADNKDNIIEFAENLGKVVKPLGEILVYIGDAAWGIFSGILSAIGDALRGIADVIVNMDLQDMSTILSLLTAILGIKVSFDIGKMFAEMSESIDGGLIDKLSFIEGYITGDGKISTGLTALAEKFTSTFASIGTAISPITTAMSEGFNSVVGAVGATTTPLTILKGLVVGVGEGFKALWGILAANPITLIVAAIALVVAALVHLWNTNKEFRQWMTDFYQNSLKPIAESIKKTFVDLWEQHLKPLWEESLKPLLGNVWETIKETWDLIANLIGEIVQIIAPVVANILQMVAQLVDDIAGYVGGCMDVLKGIIEFITGVFSGDWEKAWNGIKDIFKGIWEMMVSLVKTPVNLIIGVINGMIRGVVSGINLVVRAINSIKVDIPDWVPLIGGKHIGFHLSEVTAPQIPTLAKGGVITSPTLAMVGEYAGADNNPEIVTPQHILKETIDASNGEVVSALYQMAQLVIAAINDVDMNVSIGDDVIAQSAKRGNDAYKNRTGKPLLA